jgi:hypothetical protein
MSGRPPLPRSAWREVNEIPDRELMRDGRWLVQRAAVRAAWWRPAGADEGEPALLLEAG